MFATERTPNGQFPFFSALCAADLCTIRPPPPSPHPPTTPNTQTKKRWKMTFLLTLVIEGITPVDFFLNVSELTFCEIFVAHFPPFLHSTFWGRIDNARQKRASEDIELYEDKVYLSWDLNYHKLHNLFLAKFDDGYEEVLKGNLDKKEWKRLLSYNTYSGILKGFKFGFASKRKDSCDACDSFNRELVSFCLVFCLPFFLSARNSLRASAKSHAHIFVRFSIFAGVLCCVFVHMTFHTLVSSTI